MALLRLAGARAGRNEATGGARAWRSKATGVGEAWARARGPVALGMEVGGAREQARRRRESAIEGGRKKRESWGERKKRIVRLRCGPHITVVNGLGAVPFSNLQPNKKWNHSIPLTKHVV